MKIRKSKLLLALGLFGCSFAAQADWKLNATSSSLFYVTSKASAVSEVNTFKTLSGAITDQGEASLLIDLASVDTNVEIRDQRMSDLVFEVARFPTATVSMKVDTAALQHMPSGGTLQGSYTATVLLHGMSQEVAVDLQIIKLNADTIQVQTAKPLLIGAGLFGLTEGVEKLRELAGLTAINPNIAVTFTLNYLNQ